MSRGMLIYLASLTALYTGLRLLEGYDAVQQIFSAMGVVGLLAATYIRYRALHAAKTEGHSRGHRMVLRLLGVAFGALVLYAMSTPEAVSAAGLQNEIAGQARVVLGALWPIFLLVATLPMLVLDAHLQRSPIDISVRRVYEVTGNGLVAALAVALVFPINFIASEHNERWDFSYFQTSRASEATQSILETVDGRLEVLIFQPASSDVAEELRGYFADLEGPKLRVKILDQAADPALSKELKVRDNGYVVFRNVGESTVSNEDKEGDEVDEKTPLKNQPELLKIGTDIDKSKEKLKNLDRDVQKRLIAMSRGELTVYFTTGHDEMHWKESKRALRRSNVLKMLMMQRMNVRRKEIGLTSGLAEDIPEDADLVVVLAPESRFMPEEIAAIERYLNRGGSLLLALEPPDAQADDRVVSGKESMDSLLRYLGVSMGEGVLASKTKRVVLYGNRADYANTVTDQFSSHPTTNALSENRLAIFTPTSGYLQIDKESKNRVTPIIRSRADSWADLDFDLDRDPAEKTQSHPIAAVIQKTGEERNFRAIVVADGSLFADIPMSNVSGNMQFAYDGINWLLRSDSYSGVMNKSEEDVKIQHTQEDQVAWFYGSVVLVPMLFLGLGLFRVRLRKRGARR